MNATILLATDLDRTLLPNGAAPESPSARQVFSRLAERPEIKLVYVSGRHRALVAAAMAEYTLPRPDFVITDVGSSLYRVDADDWHRLDTWHQAIIRDWGGNSHAELAVRLQSIPGLRMQEASKQGECKLSFYAPPLPDPAGLLDTVRGRLDDCGARVKLIWSVDETTATGLLDVLPANAGKLHALDFLRTQLGMPLQRTLFAGDSGNDMDVLVSPIPSVLVANAQDAVRAEAARRAEPATLYLAAGGLLGMNGHYSAGILEGLVHFLPETRVWLESDDQRNAS